MDEIALAKRKQVFDFLKFGLGTVVLGLFAQWINLTIQEKQIELEVQKAETGYLEVFVSKYMALETVQQKLDYVEFMRIISKSVHSRARYDSLYREINRKMEMIEEKEKTIAAILDEIPKEDLKEMENAQEELNDIESKNALDERDIRKKQELENKISRTTEKYESEFKRASEVKQAIQQINPGMITSEKEEPESKIGITYLKTDNDRLPEEGKKRYKEYLLEVVKIEGKKAASFRISKNNQQLGTYDLAVGKKAVIRDGDHVLHLKLNGIFPSDRSRNYAAHFDFSVIKNIRQQMLQMQSPQ